MAFELTDTITQCWTDKDLFLKTPAWNPPDSPYFRPSSAQFPTKFHVSNPVPPGNWAVSARFPGGFRVAFKRLPPGFQETARVPPGFRVSARVPSYYRPTSTQYRAIVFFCFHLYHSLSNIIVLWFVESLRRSVSAARCSPQMAAGDFRQSATHDIAALANALFEQWARSSIDMKGIYKLIVVYKLSKRRVFEKFSKSWPEQ